VLPYWGNLADRKTLRRLLAPSRLYGRAAPFHVALTSYQIAVADEAVLKKVKWQFMVLDEAQVCVGGGVGGCKCTTAALHASAPF
jgi:DNA helicase INO80